MQRVCARKLDHNPVEEIVIMYLFMYVCTYSMCLTLKTSRPLQWYCMYAKISLRNILLKKKKQSNVTVTLIVFLHLRT